MSIIEMILVVACVIALLPFIVVPLVAFICMMIADFPKFVVESYQVMFEMFHDIASYIKEKISGKAEVEE